MLSRALRTGGWTGRNSAVKTDGQTVLTAVAQMVGVWGQQWVGEKGVLSVDMWALRSVGQ